MTIMFDDKGDILNEWYTRRTKKTI
jgi:hypothetical protein